MEAPKRTGIYRWYGEFIRNILKKSKAILDDYYLIYYYFIISNAVVTAKSIDIMYQLSVCTEKIILFPIIIQQKILICKCAMWE